MVLPDGTTHAGRTPAHWRRVALIVARRTGKRVGLDTSTRMAADAREPTPRNDAGGQDWPPKSSLAQEPPNEFPSFLPGAKVTPIFPRPVPTSTSATRIGSVSLVLIIVRMKSSEAFLSAGAVAVAQLSSLSRLSQDFLGER